MVSLCIFLLSLADTYYPYSRGALLTSCVVLYALTAGFAGYTSSVQYKLMNGDNWVSTVATSLSWNCLCSPQPAVCRLPALEDSAACTQLHASTRRLSGREEPLPTSSATYAPSAVWGSTAGWLNPVLHHEHCFVLLHVQLLKLVLPFSAAPSPLALASSVHSLDVHPRFLMHCRCAMCC